MVFVGSLCDCIFCLSLNLYGFVVISCTDRLDYVCVDIIYMKRICFRVWLHDLHL
jgi:hypothetical protein